MSAQRGVDVLAVMDEAARSQAIREDRNDMREARAAVAAVIEDIKAIREMGALMGMYTPGMDRRLRAALARMDPQPGEQR